MRIAYIYTALTTFGGVDRVLTEKANYLADKLGYEVYIITDTQLNRPPVFPLSSNVKHIDLCLDFGEQYKYGIIKRYFCYRSLMKQYKKKLEETLLQIKPQITITTCGRDLDIINDLKDGSIKIGESHTTKEYMRNLYQMVQKGFPYSFVARRWMAKMENAVKLLSDFVVLNQHDAMSWEKIRPVHIISNSLTFSTVTQSDLNHHRVICVGRLSIEKGADRMIEIWKKVSKRHPEWVVEWFGNGPLQEQITTNIKDAHIEHSFHINAPTQNIKEEYLKSDIYALCSRFEGFGMVLIEAMSCGIPCVSYDCPHGPRTIIENEKNGFLVEDGNTDAFIYRLEQLMTDIELRKKMGVKAKETSAQYAPEIIMKQWDELFKNIVNKAQ